MRAWTPKNLNEETIKQLVRLIDRPWRKTWRWYWDRFRHLFLHEWANGPDNATICSWCGKSAAGEDTP